MDLGMPLGPVVGTATARVLGERLGLRTVEDLLRHYPRRYYARGELTPLHQLQAGEHATVQARVVSVKGRVVRPRLTKYDVVLTDGTSPLHVTFFNRRGAVARLVPGRTVVLAGRIERFRGRLSLTNPEVDFDDEGEDFAGGLRPVYPATAGMSTSKIAKAVRVLTGVLGAVPDPLPEEIRARRRLIGLDEALRLVHRPADRRDVDRAQARLRYDEALVLQLELLRRRAAAGAMPAVSRRGSGAGLLAAFDAQLPFRLTPGQLAVGEQIAADLAGTHPMHRLLQGEVGAGKTVVAVRAMLAVVDAGGQAVLLAPTEVLAQQHHRSVTALLGPLAGGGMLGGSAAGTRVALVTGSAGAAARRAALLQAASGEAGIVIGTHALLEERVRFADLGLVVVDEQHRFGVEQRAALAAKAPDGSRPHVLVMTATPIPRTVAMTVFGDLDVSTLAELPHGRAAIATHVVPAGEKPHFLDRAWARVREEIAAGRQAYVVCPRIGGDGLDGPEETHGAEGDGEGMPTGDAPAERDGVRRPVAVLDLAAALVSGPLAGLSVEVLHGQLAPEAKDEVMRRFGAGEVQVLVATTVVEVGVDVANASVMVVMDADRFGVSQLHQLRGRVGRGSAPGLCLLVTDLEPGRPGRTRLDAVAATTDGFQLSRVDLEQRREGDVLGATQSGRRSSLRLLSVLRDEAVIVAARDDAAALLARDPRLSAHPALAAAVTVLGEDRADYLVKG